ncbi:beta-glucosidase [Marinomonas mediterranea]|uniref:GH1 family beta-glucosidase n=1 Tax=Marinomonas mediterranea TaxID=119864 RepID=UPI002349AB39|nr:GH1 family beta-glucosidase [Marinomonas mediterranea]WCN11718.1 beta-glucosidase [Marinomonas mediterranea]
MSITLPNNSIMLKPDFTFGVATASFQIEGANTEDGRLPCIWDTFCATPGKVFNGDDGSVACDHYHLWKEDVQLIKSLGVDAYRLSIAWPRVMDEQGEPNEKGLLFYRNLIKELKANGIKVFATLYHWDLPQHLEDKGGWLNRETAYRYAEYANLITNELGQWVDSWATFNEPFCAALLGYEVGVHAPGLAKPEYGRQAAHHILLAHGLALPAIRANSPTADVGIVLNMNRIYAASDKSEDQFAALVRETLDNQFFIEPLLKAQYPKLLNNVLPHYLPTILPGDMEIIARSIDFIGMNFYTCNHNEYDEENLYREVKKENVEYTDIGWEIAPQAFNELLINLNEQYDLPPMYITENGAACADTIEAGKVDDDQRVRYLQGHINAVNDAITAGVDIRGYFAWSLMDNFEWAEGYSKRFGLTYVDYETQERTIKRSGYAYRDLLLSRQK